VANRKREEIRELLEELCSDDEQSATTAFDTLLATENLGDVAKQMASAIQYGRNNPEILYARLLQLPAPERILKGLLELSSALIRKGKPYQQKAHQSVLDGIEELKAAGDAETIEKIVTDKYFASDEIIASGKQALESMGNEAPETKPAMRPTLRVDSLNEVTIEDDWIKCSASMSTYPGHEDLTLTFNIEGAVIQMVKIKTDDRDDCMKVLKSLEERGFIQSSTRKEPEFEYFYYKREI